MAVSGRVEKPTGGHGGTTPTCNDRVCVGDGPRAVPCVIFSQISARETPADSSPERRCRPRFDMGYCPGDCWLPRRGTRNRW